MFFFNKEIETMQRNRLVPLQMKRLRTLLSELYNKNPFYTKRLRDLGAEPSDFTTIAALQKFPFTTKQKLLDDQAANPLFGSNLTYPESAYTRFHQTSGTTGKPLLVPDTAGSWDWWGRCWGTVLAGAGLTANDRLFVAFGFGPFIGFWAAVEGARHINAMMVPGGGRDSLQRLHLMRDAGCTALCCTPTYALRLAEVAVESNLDLKSFPIRATIHAGEPGASVPATKKRIEWVWGAKCYDHAGATEIGAHSFECLAQPGGIHINEAEFIAEVIDPDAGAPVATGQPGELVLTNLGRFGFPVIRYRTGDIVKLADEVCDCGRTFVRCEGGILGRWDDMLTVRGVNIYPSAIENVLRAFDEINEFRVTVARERHMDVLRIEIECIENCNRDRVADNVAAEISRTLGLRPAIQAVDRNTLPRFELKARRFFVKR
ncbi:MAG: phenylacetate--CoA ligase family protein [bacterium]